MVDRNEMNRCRKWDPIFDDLFSSAVFNHGKNVDVLRVILENIYESFTPYILTKNLKHQEVIDDIFNISTYVSNIYTNNSFGTTKNSI